MAVEPDSRTAIVHDYFVQDGGAERVAIELADMLPTATVHTTFFSPTTFGSRMDARRVRPWRLNNPFLARHFRSLLPVYPAYFSSLDLRRYELVVSNSSAFAKAVRTSRRGVHVAYIQTPLRAAWQFQAYAGRSSLPVHARVLGQLMGRPLRAWDRRTSARPDLLVANSQNIRRRIRAVWGRDAEVIHPAVDTSEFAGPAGDDGYLLVAARLLRYRRIDLAVDAARLMGRELVVVGDGPERAALQARAGTTTRFEGHVPRPRLVELMTRCHAYLVPGEEDFGIAPVEAMAAGKPVVAFGRGGVTETVLDGVTGVFFARQTAASLAAAIERLDSLQVQEGVIRGRAGEFDRESFRARWAELFERLGVDRSLYASPANPARDR